MTAPRRAPVALLIFNRPDLTARTFEAVRRARPPRLLVVADGPRADVEGEEARCTHARDLTEDIDWKCEVSRDYSEVNLGCKRRIATGLDWVFDQVDEAIVLEDDCTPSSDFFPYCEELLERYREAERVMHIGGSNLRWGRRGDDSYFFSRYPHVWGWASWRRAWRLYDPDLTAWRTGDKADKRRVLRIFDDPRERAFWLDAWNGSGSGEIDTWDFQWAFACMANDGLAINPNFNLVTNAGFIEDSTHTPTDPEGIADMPHEKPDRPLRHPTTIQRDASCDAGTARRFFRLPDPPTAVGRMRTRVGRRLRPYG